MRPGQLDDARLDGASHGLLEPKLEPHVVGPHTPDLGGQASTAQVTQAVCRQLAAAGR